MDRQERAIIQLECQQLLNRATLLLDSRQWQSLANCYSEDAVLFRPSDAGRGITGRNAIYQSFCERAPRTSCHIITNSVFEVIEQKTVIVNSRVWMVAGEVSAGFPVTADKNLMIGSFNDTLVNIEENWLIHLRKGSIELIYNGL